MQQELVERTRARLDALCLTHPDRHVGGEGSKAANELFARDSIGAGARVERISFDCVDWEYTDAWLRFDAIDIPLHVGPYSPPFNGVERLIPVSTVEELEVLTPGGGILLLHGPIAAEQLTPRKYPFYQMEQHARIYAALDAAAPAAVIAATDRTPMAAALHPFPLFEDADAGFPSAYVLNTAGKALLDHAGEDVELEIQSRQVPATGEQLVASFGPASAGRIAVAAHIDSRHGTPGALDNATGVCVLLALADLFGDTPPPVEVQLLPFNGEDNFAAYGEIAYLSRYGDSLPTIRLAINIDAAGRTGDMSAISFYECPEEIRVRVLYAADAYPRIVEGPKWPMSDHMVFAMRGVPAMAVTSTSLERIAAEIAHTAEDVPSLTDPSLVVQTAEFIHDVIEALGTLGEGGSDGYQ